MDVSELITLNYRDFNKYILSCSSEQRKFILNDKRVRYFLFEKENKPNLIWLISHLKDDEIFYLCDDDFLKLLSSCKFKNDIFNALFSYSNPYINQILINPNTLEIIYDEILSVKFYLSSMNIDFGEAWFEFLLTKHPDCLFYITFLNTEIQKELFVNHIDKMFSTDSPLLDIVSGQVFNSVVNHPCVRYYILSCSSDVLEDKINTGFIVPTDLAVTKELVSKFSYIDDINEYREIMNIIQRNNSLFFEAITDERQKYYSNFIDSINDYGLSEKYTKVYNNILNGMAWNYLLDSNNYQDVFEIQKAVEDGQNVVEILQTLTEKEMLECTIDYAFEDFSFDVLSNIKLVLDFNDNLEVPIISNDRLQLYNNLLNYQDLSLSDKKQLFMNLSKIKNNVELFYDDVRACKDYCYKLLNASISDKSNANECLSEELSIRYNLPVYELNGEDFFSLITVTKHNRDNNNLDFIKTFSNTASMSFISNNHIGTFSDPLENVVLGFSDFDIDKVAHLYETDSYTSHEFGSHERSKFYTPNDLIDHTYAYNEMLYLNKVNGQDTALKPSYIMCFDEIKPGDIAASKLNGNIPLILLHSEFYRKNNNNHLEISSMVEKDTIYSELSDDLPYDYHRRIK